MARGYLGWSAADLAKAAGLHESTIKRLEKFDGVPEAKISTMRQLRSALHANGVEFIVDQDKVGVLVRLAEGE